MVVKCCVLCVVALRCSLFVVYERLPMVIVVCCLLSAVACCVCLLSCSLSGVRCVSFVVCCLLSIPCSCSLFCGVCMFVVVDCCALFGLC